MSACGQFLIIGADSTVGQALARHLHQKGEMPLTTTRRPETVSDTRLFLELSMDISDWCLPAQTPVAYFGAGVTSIERCRTEPDTTAFVNVTQTVRLARSLVENGAFVIFLSTNLVFDGSVPLRKSDDPVCPATEYGRQKAEAERLLLELGDAVSIVRLTKVLHPTMPLITGWIRSLRNHEPVHPFSDMVMAPVPIAFVVRVLHRLGEQHMPGIVQVSGAQDITYEQAVRYIARCLDVSQTLVQPMRAQEAERSPEAVPAYTTLDTTRLRQELRMECPPVWPAIASVFNLQARS